MGNLHPEKKEAVCNAVMKRGGKGKNTERGKVQAEKVLQLLRGKPKEGRKDKENGNGT